MKVLIASAKDTTKTTAVNVPPTATVDDLKAAFRPTLSVHRKLFKFSPAGATAPLVLEGRKTIASYGVEEGSVVTFRDLGPQVGYRTVFLVEYAGPIALMMLYAMQPTWIYGTGNGKRGLGDTQWLFVVMFLAHFVKRELETLFVHKFSRPTMPLMNIVKNSVYYWSFAAFIGYFLCHPLYTAPRHGWEKACAVAWLLMELGNFAVHVQLGTMRKGDGDTSRSLPRGPLFWWVTCPNYTFEVAGWLFFSIGCNVLMSYAFTALGMAQMTEWALKKRAGYIKADPAVRRKKSIVPFVI